MILLDPGIFLKDKHSVFKKEKDTLHQIINTHPSQYLVD